MEAYKLWVIVAIEGFVALAVQMLTIRQLMPFVGNSVAVTSLVIGLFLLALAVGYRQGGLVEAEPLKRLIRNFILAAIWLGIGLSYLFLAYWFLSLQQLTGLGRYGLLIAYLLLITVPMVYWLGQTVPMVMNLWQTKQRAGDIGGRVLQLSTIGSFLGAVLTSVVIMNHLGLGWTVFIATFLLLALVWVLCLPLRHGILISLGVAGLLSFFYWLNVVATQLFFIETNNYAQYNVVQDVAIYQNTPNAMVGDVLVINQPARF